MYVPFVGNERMYNWKARSLYNRSIFVALTCSVIMLTLGIWMAASGVVDFRGVETNVLFTIQKALLGSPLYTDPTEVPFDIAQYGPFYYLTCIGFCRSLGVSGLEPSRVLLISRLWSVACVFILVFIIYQTLTVQLAVRRSLAIAVCCFAIVAIAPWSFLARPDTMMSVFLFASLSCSIPDDSNTGQKKRVVLLVATIAFAFLAAGVKQNGAQIIPALLLYLISMKEWRMLTIAMITCAALCVISLALVPCFFGPHIAANVLGGIDNGVDLATALRRVYLPFLMVFSVPLLMIFVCSLQSASEIHLPIQRFLMIALIFMFGFATITATKVGSALNYYNDFLILGAMVVAYVAQSSESRQTSKSYVRIVPYLGVFLLIAFLPIVTLQRCYEYYYKYCSPRSVLCPAEAHCFSRNDDVADYLRASLQERHTRYVLTFNDLRNVLPEMCVMPQVEVADLCQKRDVFDFSRFGSYIENGTIRFLVLRRGEPPKRSLLGFDLGRFSHTIDFAYTSVYEHDGRANSDNATQQQREGREDYQSQ